MKVKDEFFYLGRLLCVSTTMFLHFYSSFCTYTRHQSASDSQRHELVISSHHFCSIIFGHHQRLQGHMICPVYTLFCGSTLTMPTGVCLYYRTQRTKHIHSDAQIRGRLDMHACMYIYTYKHTRIHTYPCISATYMYRYRILAIRV